MTLASRVLVVALAAGLVAGADGSAPPSPDPTLMAEVAEQQQAALEALDSVTLSDAQRADATFDLRPDDAVRDLVAADATFDLRPEDSTTPLETVIEEGEETTVRLTSDLLFQFGKHEVTKNAAAAVRDLLDDIPEGAKVTVDGHTDSIGDDASNDRLSQRRADAVAGILREARPDLRLTVKGHGEQQPIAENEIEGKDNPAGRAKNRRVEVGYDRPAD
ncbi:OmpA family protein [Promicromonospora sp. CA-289599]|uniref:OmpA family protein n=1 Tax=Promicromonospora sp. CA-289599 TaxID=3240014 RepID=UPI003D8AFC40